MDWRKYLKNLPPEKDSDQSKGIPRPPVQKPYSKDSLLIDLVSPEDFKEIDISLFKAINNRESRRAYSDNALTLEELSFLLWSTQGVKELLDRNGAVSVRVVPSGGSLHPYETYLVIENVESIIPGLDRYLPVEHKLLVINTSESNMIKRIAEISNRQAFIGEAGVVFIWTAIPYRTEWRYGVDLIKDILMGVGHICQNLYLACEAINAGTCAIVSYKQGELDSFLGLDGEEEISLYLAPVGKV